MYGYHDAALYVTMAGAADEFGDTDVIPQSEITADMLTSESYALYLMADSVYEVETKA